MTAVNNSESRQPSLNFYDLFSQRLTLACNYAPNRNQVSGIIYLLAFCFVLLCFFFHNDFQLDKHGLQNKTERNVVKLRVHFNFNVQKPVLFKLPSEMKRSIASSSLADRSKMFWVPYSHFAKEQGFHHIEKYTCNFFLPSSGPVHRSVAH